ncbi:MAG TPA: hypothetical protein PKY82_15570 [Pyrinomonadaceae bacterium]|nr:hypothetical protein [Pyrinomonadaceae bacterium]
MPIEKLFKYSLITTFFMNLAGALTFIPSFHTLREFGGLPESGNPFYGWIIALWIFFFGILYLLLAFSKKQERFFVIIGALGKSSFAILLAILALTGELPIRAAFAGIPDLIIALIFLVWLNKART